MLHSDYVTLCFKVENNFSKLSVCCSQHRPQGSSLLSQGSFDGTDSRVPAINLQKTLTGGIILMELSFRQEFFCVRMFAVDCSQLGFIVNQQVYQIILYCVQKVFYQIILYSAQKVLYQMILFSVQMVLYQMTLYSVQKVFYQMTLYRVQYIVYKRYFIR